MVKWYVINWERAHCGLAAALRHIITRNYSAVFLAGKLETSAPITRLSLRGKDTWCEQGEPKRNLRVAMPNLLAANGGSSEELRVARPSEMMAVLARIYSAGS